ncbi:hypothetical protein [Denitratimonas sp. CY0512]|uniref:hypothetical protein n=1 Tax=Denitratimonas sp. CY0512 TaxID=3131940 RepID=UPI0030A47107
MSEALAHASFVDSRRRHIVLVGLFDALDWAGIRPVAPAQLNALWYLANALAPAWRLAPFDAAVLKTERPPYFPMLQRDLDALVGMGMLDVAGLEMDAQRSRMEGRFALNRSFADPVLAIMRTVQEEADLLEFLGEVVQALNRLTDAEQRTGLVEDATYADPDVDIGNVVDLGEWLEHGGLTRTADVLERIEALAGEDLEPAQCMDIYLDHLGRRLRHA